MTVLDTSLPNIPVLMELGPHEPVREAPLPAGYRLAPWDPSLREAWVRLHVALGHLGPTVEDGLAYFDRTYGADPVACARQMVVAVDNAGRLAGTSSLWVGRDFGDERLRVHWVGVDPAHQRRGIARALVLETIRRYDELVPSGRPPLYLSTQTGSWPACGMYRKLGFVAYRGPAPAGWGMSPEEFSTRNDEAWRLIDARLARASARDVPKV